MGGCSPHKVKRPSHDFGLVGELGEEVKDALDVDGTVVLHKAVYVLDKDLVRGPLVQLHKVARAAPLERASIPTDPVPAKRSSHRHSLGNSDPPPILDRSMENTALLTLPIMGRTSLSLGPRCVGRGKTKGASAEGSGRLGEGEGEGEADQPRRQDGASLGADDISSSSVRRPLLRVLALQVAQVCLPGLQQLEVPPPPRGASPKQRRPRPRQRRPRSPVSKRARGRKGMGQHTNPGVSRLHVIATYGLCTAGCSRSRTRGHEPAEQTPGAHASVHFGAWGRAAPARRGSAPCPLQSHPCLLSKAPSGALLSMMGRQKSEKSAREMHTINPGLRLGKLGEFF